jgi:hypothetical protein
LIESGPPKDHFNSNFLAKDFDVILSHNIPKLNKLAEKISQKNPEYKLNADLYRLCKLGIFL